MNLDEAGRLLAKVAGYDNRTVGDANILAWHEALSDVDYHDALQAVAAHFRDSTDYLMPVHVRRGAEAIDRHRRRTEREALEADAAYNRAIESAHGFGPDDIRRGTAVLARLREQLPPGEPAKLRGTHWLATHASGQLRDGTRLTRSTAPAVPNPYYDPAAAARLLEMNAAAAPHDAPDPRSEQAS